MSVLFADDFNRTDSTDIGSAYDAGYTGFDNFQIVGNAIRSTTVDATGAMETLNSPSIGNDQYAQATISAWTTPGAGLLAAFLVLRASAPATLTYYFGGPAFFSGTTWWEIWKSVAGVETRLLQVVLSAATNDVVLFTVAGTTLNLYKTGALVGSVSDSDIASGRPGFRVGLEAGVSALADVQLDNFSTGIYWPDLAWITA